MSNADAAMVVTLLAALLVSQAWGWWCWYRWGRATDKWQEAIERNKEYIAMVQTERQMRKKGQADHADPTP